MQDYSKRGVQFADIEEFGLFLDSLREKLLSFGNVSMLPTRLREDCVQDVYLAALRKFAVDSNFIEGSSSPITYIFSVAKKTALFYHRLVRQERLIPSSQLSESLSLDSLVFDGPTPLEQCEQRETIETVVACLDNLSPDLRAQIEPPLLSDESCAATARNLGMPASTVKDHYHRFRESMLKKVS